jgi:phosphoribosylaminoimidazolecarboxamide formyltransferase / IMP cyclohydrolase
MTLSDRPIRRALISVSDKNGIDALGRFLAERGIEILSTGGSAKALRAAGIAVKEVASHTGFPEIMDGRVKTLHPKIHGGLLSRRDDPAHVASQAEHGIGDIDLLVVNLYPFRETVAAGKDWATAIETIDVGGPAMIRAAAKNHDFVTVLVEPGDYQAVMAEMKAGKNATTLATRRRLARAAFAHTAAYDAAIAEWMANSVGQSFPAHFVISGDKAQDLRYGENPHQKAAFYRLAGQAGQHPGVASARQLQGKELSYNNLNDTDAAFELAAEFERPAVVIVKHANPCGVAIGAELALSYRRALACDPVSAFGGIIALNRALDTATAELIAKLFVELVIAPGFAREALAILAGKPNIRVLETQGMPDPAVKGLALRWLAGGFLLQDRDTATADASVLKIVTKRRPSEAEMADMLFAFKVAKHVKSNAIVYARDGATVGIGAGQMSRVDSARIAAWKAAEAAKAAGLKDSLAKGSVVASDAFFPFADGLLAAAEAGATAIIQPGGSMRDSEVIAAADERNLAMVFTGQRHFRH